MLYKNQADGLRKSKRDTTALALVGAMFVALAMVCGVSLSAIGSGALHDAMNAMGFGRFSAIETEQRRQAAVLASLEPMIQSVASEVGALNRRVRTAEPDILALNDRFALIDSDIAALVAELKSVRAQTGTDAWREPVERLDTSVAATRADLGALRLSLDDQAQTHHKEIGALTKDLGAFSKRLERLEQTVSRDLTASIASRRKIVRRKPPVRPAATGTPAAANAS